MESITEVINRITPANEKAGEAAQRRWDSIAKPLGSLGLFEDSVVKLAALYGDPGLKPINPCLLVFCADNGVVSCGVTQCGSDVTAKVAIALAEGRSSVSPMAAAAGCRVIPVDMGILDFAGHPGVLNRRVRNGTEDISRTAAMSREECLTAMEYGAALVRELAEEGVNLFLIGEMGIGNTTTCAATAAALLGLSAETVTGRGAGLSDSGLARKREAVRCALQVNMPDASDPTDVLTKVGGLDLAAMCGAFLGASACGAAAVIDGMISAVSALCACCLCPASKKAMFASHVSAEPGGQRILDAIGLEAPIRARMRLGEGSGAVMLLPMLDMALRVYCSEQSFEKLGIEAYVPQN